jgi:hypothetical protein
VQSAAAYQELLKAAEMAASIAGIRRGLEQSRRGEARPMRKFLEGLAAKNGIPLK